MFWTDSNTAADSSSGTTTTSVCSEGQTLCGDGVTCISNGWLCDYDNDCGDNSDEAGCYLDCDTANYFQCADVGGCIVASWECDGWSDCYDESDESSCDTGEIFAFHATASADDRSKMSQNFQN